MSTEKDKNELDKVLNDLAIYQHPKYLKPEYVLLAEKVKDTKKNKEKIKKYFALLMNIRNAYEKIKKYETYFSEFYPPSSKSIKNYEALEHHIHAYLEDLTIFKNKVMTFLGQLKNDLKKIAKNKKEIEKALKFLIASTSKVFANVSEYRDPHHHKGHKFIDSNLLDAQITDTILKETNPQTYLTPANIKKVEEKNLMSFEKAKTSWVKRAKKNKKELSGFLDEVIKRNKDFLYKLLKIKPIVYRTKKTPAKKS